MKLDLAGAIRDKFAYNQQRADHKLENRKREGGKRYSLWVHHGTKQEIR